MHQILELRNTFFNFRIRPSELKKLHQATKKLGFVSASEFVRSSIREKIIRDVKNGQ